MSFHIDLEDIGVDFFKNNDSNNKNDPSSSSESSPSSSSSSSSKRRRRRRRGSSSNKHATRNKHHDSYKSSTILQSATHQKLELEQTKHSLLQAHQDNKLLIQEKDKLLEKISNMNSRYSETKKALLQIMDTVAYRERELCTAEMQWRNIVEQERKVVDDERLKLWNQRQLESNIRNQIRSEIGIEYEEKVKALVRAKEEHEQNYHTLHQQFEVNKVNYQVAIETMKKEVKAIKSQRDNDVNELQTALSKYIEDNEGSIDRLDQVQMNLDEANVTIEKLILNERELKKSLDHAVDERKNQERENLEAVSLHEIALNEMRSTLLSKVTQLQKCQNEIGHLRKTLDNTNVQLNTKTDDLAEEHAKVSSLLSQLQAKNDMMHQLREDLKREHQQCNSDIHGRLNIIKQENETLKRKERLIEGQLSDARSSLNRLKTESVEREEDLKRQMESKLNQTTIENCALQRKVSELEALLKNQEVELKDTTRNLTHAVEVSNHNAEIIKKENESLVKQYRMSENSNSELKQEYQEVSEKMEKSCCDLLGLQRQLDSCNDKLLDAENAKLVCKGKLDKMTLEYESLQNATSNEKEQLRFEANELSSKLATLQKQMEDTMQEREIKFESELRKERKKAACYKEKAMDAYTKSLYAKQLLREQDQQHKMG